MCGPQPGVPLSVRYQRPRVVGRGDITAFETREPPSANPLLLRDLPESSPGRPPREAGLHSGSGACTSRAERLWWWWWWAGGGEKPGGQALPPPIAQSSKPACDDAPHYLPAVFFCIWGICVGREDCECLGIVPPPGGPPRGGAGERLPSLFPRLRGFGDMEVAEAVEAVEAAGGRSATEVENSRRAPVISGPHEQAETGGGGAWGRGGRRDGSASVAGRTRGGLGD